jgi:hypothetical protein
LETLAPAARSLPVTMRRDLLRGRLDVEDVHGHPLTEGCLALEVIGLSALSAFPSSDGAAGLTLGFRHTQQIEHHTRLDELTDDQASHASSLIASARDLNGL